MSKESTISERMKKLRARHGWTQDDMGLHLGFTRSYISQLESDTKTAGPKFIAKLLAFEQAPDGPVKWMVQEQSNSTKEDPATYPALTTMEIPVLSWAQAGAATEFEELPADWMETITVQASAKKAVAIKLRGDSMEPRFQDGDVAVVLPSIAPSHGELVVANIKGEGCVFKMLNLVGGDPNKINLTSYNPLYTPRACTRDMFHWIYPVDSVIKRVRR